jgi:hypothetical protein
VPTTNNNHNNKAILYSFFFFFDETTTDKTTTKTDGDDGWGAVRALEKPSNRGRQGKEIEGRAKKAGPIKPGL